jgi:hypothetical protein
MSFLKCHLKLETQHDPKRKVTPGHPAYLRKSSLESGGNSVRIHRPQIQGKHWQLLMASKGASQKE